MVSAEGQENANAAAQLPTLLELEKPILELESKIEELRELARKQNIDVSEQIKELSKKSEELKKEIYSNLTPWYRVQIARHPKRLYPLDYINALFADFIELHGDRNFGDDKAIIGGMGFFNNTIPVVVIGTQKGRNLEENKLRNFGMAHPEGYRKALRLMMMAAKFNYPIITLLDTPGAFPGVGAEERGQAEAIARNLKFMSTLPVPIIVVITGEGGSGGALGLGVGDRILMLENSIYSVISPEGCAAILFRDASKAPEAALALKLTAEDLYSFKIVDDVIPEPLGGVHHDPAAAIENVRKYILKHLEEIKDIPPARLIELRYKKYKKMGVINKIKLRKEKVKKNAISNK